MANVVQDIWFQQNIMQVIPGHDLIRVERIKCCKDPCGMTYFSQLHCCTCMQLALIFSWAGVNSIQQIQVYLILQMIAYTTCSTSSALILAIFNLVILMRLISL